MALSNICKEPRREITESLVGIGIVAGVVYGDYLLAKGIFGIHPDRFDFVLVMVLIPIVLAIGSLFSFGLLHLTHAVGEGICNSLADHGLELRPKNRPARR